MPTPQVTLNPIDGIIAGLALVMSPAAAAVIGPFAAIIMASTAGAAWSVGRRNSEKSGSAVWFFLKLNAAAFIFAAGAALIAERWLGPDTRHWTVAPIALLIGAVGDDWPKVFSKTYGVILRAFGKKIAGSAD